MKLFFEIGAMWMDAVSIKRFIIRLNRIFDTPLFLCSLHLVTTKCVLHLNETVIGFGMSTSLPAASFNHIVPFPQMCDNYLMQLHTSPPSVRVCAMCKFPQLIVSNLTHIKGLFCSLSLCVWACLDHPHFLCGVACARLVFLWFKITLFSIIKKPYNYYYSSSLRMLCVCNCSNHKFWINKSDSNDSRKTLAAE